MSNDLDTLAPDDSAKVTLDRLSVEDLRDEFHDTLNKIVNKANEAIESAESEVNNAIDKLSDAKSRIEELEKEASNTEAELDKLRTFRKQVIDFDAVERLVNFAPGDPGHMYPLHVRVEKVLAKALTDRDDAIASRNAKWQASDEMIKSVQTELQNLKDAIVPELERLEGHEKRLRVIVDEFAGKVKGERLATLLREAKEVFNEAQQP